MSVHHKVHDVHPALQSDHLKKTTDRRKVCRDTRKTVIRQLIRRKPIRVEDSKNIRCSISHTS